MILILTAISCIVLASIIAFQDSRKLAHVLFISICLFFAIWSIAVLSFLQTDNADVAFVSAKIFYLVAGLFPAFLFMFAASFPKRLDSISSKTLLWVGGLALAMSLIIVFKHSFVISGVVISPDGNYGIIDNVSYLIYSAYFIVFFSGAIAIALMNFFKYKDSQKMQAGLYAIGILINSVPGFITNLIMPFYGNYKLIWVGPAASIFFLALTAYSIARHGLFSIKRAAVRSTAYIITLATLSVVYYGFAQLISVALEAIGIGAVIGIGPINIAIALFLAFIFQPIKNFFDKVTNHIFYKDAYSSDKFYARLNQILSSTTDLRLLLKRTSGEIANTLKAEQAFIFTFYGDNRHISSGTENSTKLPVRDALDIKKYVSERDGSILVSELTEYIKIKRIMTSHKLAIVLPLVRGGDVIGYLCLGDHLSSRYSSTDIRVLETISDELVIAIQNALSIEDVRDINATLQQRVDNATKELRANNELLKHLDEAKDEFVSIASHQLRTPLTSVKGYISMLIEGDAGKITKNQKVLLEEAFNSSERMVRLINDFLNVSRLQTGKFMIDLKSVNLAKVVEQELDSLKTNADSRNMKFSYKMPKNIPVVNLDEGKIRQVIMNFADNALYYSHEKANIKVELKVEKDDIVFTIKDTGIGVPRAEQSKLFTKFYRASNARRQRPDGTGVGLFMAKKVIDAHGGHVVFESIEGKGSVFGFRLPLNKVLTVNDSN